MFDHPRWGVIPCLATIHTIQEQEEVFVKYGYDLDYCPDWYLAAWEQGEATIIKKIEIMYLNWGEHLNSFIVHCVECVVDLGLIFCICKYVCLGPNNH